MTKNSPNQPDSESAPSAILNALRNKPIPCQKEATQRRIGFRNHPINLADPRNSEPLVDLAAFQISGINYYNRPDNPPYYISVPGSIPTLMVRTGIAKQLQQANRYLNRFNLELFIHDGYRPVAVQRYFYETWMPKYLKEKDPTLTGSKLTEEVEKYWSRPPSLDEVQKSPSPHLTGGAVDLTLAFKQSKTIIEMGGLFDDPNPVSHRDYYEKIPLESVSDVEAQAWRRVLHWTMTEHGFVGHPFEWWHFSIGDQLWARLTGAPEAYYGAAKEALAS